MEDEGTVQVSLSEIYDKGYKAGIREVVEYLKPFTVEAPMAGEQLGQFVIRLERQDCRKQLKDWGLDPRYFDGKPN